MSLSGERRSPPLNQFVQQSLPSGEITDADRIDYLDRHLRVCRQAIADGVPLKGYFSWSLLDNYEWSLGYDKRFGLVHVDFETLERRPKDSWHQLRAALAGNGQLTR